MKNLPSIFKSLFGVWLILGTSAINLFSQNTNEKANEWWFGGNLNINISCNNSDFETIEFGENLQYRYQVEGTNPVNLGIGIKKSKLKLGFFKSS